jgi:hypothetical protein
VTEGLPLFVKGNLAEVVNFTVDSDTATTLIQLDFASTATILACDANFNPHVLIGSYDQADFLHSRSSYSDITAAVTVGFTDPQLDTLTILTETWAVGVTATYLAGINIIPIVALTCIDVNGDRVYKYYQVQFAPIVAAVAGTDSYVPVAPPAANGMAYATNTITLDIKSALTGASCGDQLVIALFTNEFLNPFSKYRSIDVYYSPNFDEITAGTFSATLTIDADPADDTLITAIVGTTYSVRIYIKRN